MSKRSRVGNLAIWKELGAATQDSGVRAFKDARLIDMSLIRPNPDQPRQSFDDEKLNELAESIRTYGLLQPIVVRKDGESFIIIAGQRRYEAHKRLEKKEIPCIIRSISEREAIEQALVENIQREDIKPIEEAECYRALMEQHDYSIRDMAAKMNKSVGYIHGRLQLLKHEDIARSVDSGEIGIFEARELAKVDDKETRQELTEQVASGELDRKALKEAVKPPKSKSPAEEEEQQERQPSAAEEAVQQQEPQEPQANVPKATVKQQEQQPSVSGKPIFRNWQQLKKELSQFEINSHEPTELQKARHMLEEMKLVISEMLKRME